VARPAPQAEERPPENMPVPDNMPLAARPTSGVRGVKSYTVALPHGGRIHVLLQAKAFRVALSSTLISRHCQPGF
jgi:hypothetical protein